MKKSVMLSGMLLVVALSILTVSIAFAQVPPAPPPQVQEMQPPPPTPVVRYVCRPGTVLGQDYYGRSICLRTGYVPAPVYVDPPYWGGPYWYGPVFGGVGIEIGIGGGYRGGGHPSGSRGGGGRGH
jgi:hypothetical protein